MKNRTTMEPIVFNGIEIPPVSLRMKSRTSKNVTRIVLKTLSFIGEHKLATFLAGCVFLITVWFPLVDWYFARFGRGH